MEATTLIDLSGIDELKSLKADKKGLSIGAGTILREIAENTKIANSHPAISQAAGTIAGPGHREAATIGGNLCLDTRCYYYNQSHWWRKSNAYCLKFRGEICHVAPKGDICRAAFCGDLAPALLVHGATVEIAGPKGRRTIPLTDLYGEDGKDYLKLEPGEILVSIYCPADDLKSAYSKVRIRSSIDFPLAGIAVASCAAKDGSTRFKLALTGTNSTPILVNTPDDLAAGEDPEPYFEALSKLVQKAASPLRTTTVTPHYRRLAISGLAKRLIRELYDA